MDPVKIDPRQGFVFLALSGGGADGTSGGRFLDGSTTTRNGRRFRVVYVQARVHLWLLCFSRP